MRRSSVWRESRAMKQSQKMRKALEKQVLPKLIADGFTGKFPHYRKFYSDRIELISFPSYKYGNAFYVLASVAYPNREKDERNINYSFFEGNIDELTADDCPLRYVLKGNFGELFYYTDVYITYICGLMYQGVSEDRAKTYKRKWYEIRVQKADENIYEKVCGQVNKKLPKVYRWWNKMSKK